MSTVVESIDVQVPVRTAYDQWTQFEEFPQFMQGVERVDQLDDTRLHWVAKVAGKTKEWDAQITEQIPDQRVAWTATSGAPNGGVVTFHRLSENTTRVTVSLPRSRPSVPRPCGWWRTGRPARTRCGR